MALAAKKFFGIEGSGAYQACRDLNLLGAAEAHILWKTRLGHYIEGNAYEPLEHVLVGQGGFCQLGCWIGGPELAPFRGLAEFDQLAEAHRQFHHYGNMIIERLRRGDHRLARDIFRNEYNQALRQVILALSVINRGLHADLR